MNQFFNTCRRCLSPKVLIILGVIIVALLIFVPVIGAVGLVVALPLIGCTVMCGAMALFVGKENKK